jgi:hypothetical protein
MNPTQDSVEFAVCLSNDECADLETWKVYRVLPDARALELGCLRVIDESGEDYLYPANRFEPVTLSEGGRSRLLASAKATA